MWLRLSNFQILKQTCIPGINLMGSWGIIINVFGFDLLIFCLKFWHLLSWRILFCSFFVVVVLSSHFKIEVMLVSKMSWEVFSFLLFSAAKWLCACSAWEFMQSFMGFFSQALSLYDFLYALKLPEASFSASLARNLGFYPPHSVTLFPCLGPLLEWTDKRKETTMTYFPFHFQ